LEIQEQYDPEKVTILSINVLNRKGQTEDEVEKYNMNYTVLFGRGAELTKKYEIKKLPHLFILDGNGTIISSERFLKADEIKAILDNLIGAEENKEKTDAID
jgi:hypothetical protein